MIRPALMAACRIVGMHETANAACKILGIPYAVGTSTYDPAGTRIWCNTQGTWQGTPLVRLAPSVGPDGRFRPTVLPPRRGSADWYRYQSNPRLYKRQEAARRYGYYGPYRDW